MAIKKVSFVGLRSAGFDWTVEIFRDCLGARTIRSENDIAGFRLDDGTLLEVYSPAEPFHSFFETGPVIGFEVDDFWATRRDLEDKGATFIGEVQSDDSLCWQHFHMPDGTVLEIMGPVQINDENKKD